VDGPSVSGPSSERFEVCFASSADIGVVDGGEGDQFDRVNLDLAVAHAVVTAMSHLRPPPQPERHRDVTRQHVRTQLPAELHELTLRQPVMDLDQDASMTDATGTPKRLWTGKFSHYRGRFGIWMIGRTECGRSLRASSGTAETPCSSLGIKSSTQSRSSSLESSGLRTCRYRE